MYSDHGDRRSRRPGSPIRASPDHRLCASPRSFSQLTTPFLAYLRLGIPTHALSSLTIKSISDTEHSRSYLPISTLTGSLSPAADQTGRTYVCPSRIQFSKNKKAFGDPRPAASKIRGLVGGPGARHRPKKQIKSLKWRYRGRYGPERLPATCTPIHQAATSLTPATVSLRKEVIQPQVLLRLPCYDFTPIMSHTLGRCPSCESACRLLVQPTFVM